MRGCPTRSRPTRSRLTRSRLTRSRPTRSRLTRSRLTRSRLTRFRPRRSALLARVRQSLAAHAVRAAKAAPTAAPGAGAATPTRWSRCATRSARRASRTCRALVAQMERLQGVSMTRADLQTILVDPASPYFGHLRLREQVRGRGAVERDVLIGRATFVDAEAPHQHRRLAPRAGEPALLPLRRGERLRGALRRARRRGRDRRAAHAHHRGRRAAARSPARRGSGCGARAPPARRRLGADATSRPTSSAGGEATATRPARAVAPPRGRAGRGARRAAQALDRHLPEIAALIDPRQFDLITARHAGVVVIQGGAGSGKTTVGLHRLAYLAYDAPRASSRRGGCWS